MRIEVGFNAAGRVFVRSEDAAWWLSAEAALQAADASETLAMSERAISSLDVVAQGDGAGFVFQGSPVELRWLAHHLRSSAATAARFAREAGHA